MNEQVTPIITGPRNGEQASKDSFTVRYSAPALALQRTPASVAIMVCALSCLDAPGVIKWIDVAWSEKNPQG